jgi:tetratricopeptide (TPR) repeat protein
VLVALLLMSGRPTHAADPRLDAARAHSQEGDAYYKLEKYTSAITEYEQAYLAKPDPSFLYNIAQCHRLMGEGAEAIKFYRRFLKDAPNAPNRAVAEKHIKDLEDAAGRQGALPASNPSGNPSDSFPGNPPAAPGPSAAPPPPLAPPPISATPATEPPLAPMPSSPTVASPALSPAASALAPTSAPVSTTPNVENDSAPSPSESHPIYSRWWFWTAVGAVVVGGIILVAAAKHDPSCPGGFTCH